MKPHGCGVVGCDSADSIYHNPASGFPSELTQIVFDSKWIRFTLLSDTGKTFVWEVSAIGSGTRLGTVKWFPRWRAYAFFPEHDTLYAPDCLRDVASFIDARMADRKTK